MGTQTIRETNVGIWKAYTVDGRPIMDEDGNYLNIPGFWTEAGARIAHQKLLAVAKHYGFQEISKRFSPGARQVTDEELEEQKARLKFGLIPDPLDFAAQVEANRAKH